MASGRFPIRPSVNGIDSMDDFKTRSPNDAPPPIPQRSHARNLSSNAPSGRRPGLAPLSTRGNDMNRSRSETVSSSASVRSRRQGFVPAKTRLDPGAVSEAGGQTSARSSYASTLRPSHSRASSSISTLNGYLAAGSADGSSGAASPVDGPQGRQGPGRRLSSLPENRNSKVQTSDSIRAAKRLLFSLFQLHGPLGEVARALKDGTPKRSTLERQLFSANAHVEELDRLLIKLDGAFEDNSLIEEQSLRPIVLAAVAALKAYGHAVKELRQQTQKAISLTDPIYVRCLMSQIYMTMIESRNICSLLGFKAKTPSAKDTPRVSKAWSSRTVTPTQPKPINNRRMRGATILQTMGENGARQMPPPVPLSNLSSRSNTMTSMTATTPRSGESFGTLPTSGLPSRSNTIRSNVTSDNEEGDEHFDRIYFKLKNACELAAQSLPHCRSEFAGRRDNAETVGQMRIAHHWALALNKCEIVINANHNLISRLRGIRVKDPAVRNQRDFWQLCDTFVQSWTELATEIKDIFQQRIDITTVKTVMRPVQRAVKEVSKTICESPLYHQAVRPGGLATLPPTFPSNINTAFAQAVGQNGPQSGYVTPVPATPLSAALGPAVQATVASTPNATNAPQEYLQHTVQHRPEYGAQRAHERMDNALNAGYGRR